MNRFRLSNENKFGAKPHVSKLNYDTLDMSEVKEVLPTVAIWETLGITEEEYYEKYHKQPVPEKALELEIENEQKNDVLQE